MFIHYKGTNVHAMGMINGTEMKMNQSPQDVRWLQPGWNEIPKQVWEQNKTSPSIKNMVNRGIISVLPDKVQVKVKTKSGNLAKKTMSVGEHDKAIVLSLFDEARAIELVKDTFNRDILQRWDDQETRIKVRKALTKQLAPLLPTEQEADRDDDMETTEEAEYYEE